MLPNRLFLFTTRKRYLSLKKTDSTLNRSNFHPGPTLYFPILPAQPLQFNLNPRHFAVRVKLCEAFYPSVSLRSWGLVVLGGSCPSIASGWRRKAASRKLEAITHSRHVRLFPSSSPKLALAVLFLLANKRITKAGRIFS